MTGNHDSHLAKQFLEAIVERCGCGLKASTGVGWVYQQDETVIETTKLSPEKSLYGGQWIASAFLNPLKKENL